MKSLKLIAALSFIAALGSAQVHLIEHEESVWLVSALIALATGTAASIAAFVQRHTTKTGPPHAIVPPGDIRADTQRLTQQSAQKAPTDSAPKAWTAPDDDTQRLWESILERREEAPKVGHAMRAVLEEALARQDPRVGLIWLGQPPATSEMRLHTNRLQCTLSRRLAEMGLALIADDSDETLHTRFELELIDQSTCELVQARSAHHSRQLGDQFPRYPVASIRARLRCRTRVEALAEGNSIANLKAAKRHGDQIDVDTVQRLACRATLASLLWGMGVTAEPRTQLAEARIAS